MGDVKHVTSTGMCLGTEQDREQAFIYYLSIIPKGEAPALSPRNEGLYFGLLVSGPHRG